MPAPLLRRFGRDRRAVAAVEFALLLPVMVTMYVGTAELARAVSNRRKVTLLTRTLADLVSQGPITSTSDIFRAGAAVLAPFDSRSAKLVISAIGVYGADASAQGRVCSSASNQSSGGSDTGKLATKSAVPVPAGFQIDKMRFVRADVSMTYAPMIGSNVVQMFFGTPTVEFSDTTPWPTRSGTQYNGSGPEVVLPGGAACPATL